MKRIESLFVLLTSMTMLMTGLAGSADADHAVTTSSIGHNYDNSAAYNLSSMRPPSLPPGIGAWESINGGPWTQKNVFSGTCSPGPTTPMEGNLNGVEGVNGGNGVLNCGDIWVSMQKFSGETDSKWGSNAWSVQENTNTFTGSNGQTDWIQFTLQNNLYTWYGWHYTWFSIWTNDLSTSPATYNHCTVSTNIFSLSSVDYIGIAGSVSDGVLHAVLTVATTSGETSFALSKNDPYGLSGHWSTVDGTILGAGGGSTAEFTSPTNVETTVGSAAHSYYSAGEGLLFTTGEQNNLNLGNPGPIECYYYGSCYVFEETTPSTN
ncbi:MAG: hypothetical protein AAE986_07000 [Thermoplasmataceae archaeon]|jgi:hypothetical protein|nr:hypothetical protein [Candidatus Thermoplasmatota archaeon]